MTIFDLVVLFIEGCSVPVALAALIGSSVLLLAAAEAVIDALKWITGSEE